jgi:hypothetical protein
MKLVAAVILALTAPGADAQAPTPAPVPAASPTPPAAAAPAKPAPKPAAELQKLAFLVGDWVHEETVHPGPMGPGGPRKGRSKVQWILGDHHLYVNYVSRNSANETVEARGLLGWDAEKKAYYMHWYDNTGMAARYSGDFSPEGTLALNAEYVHQGNPVREQLTIKQQEGGKVLFSSAMAGPDGAPKPVLESVATADKR